MSQVQTIRVILLLCLGVSAGLIFVDKAPLLCSEMEPGNTERPPMKTLRIIIRSFIFLRSNFFLAQMNYLLHHFYFYNNFYVYSLHYTIYIQHSTYYLLLTILHTYYQLPVISILIMLSEVSPKFSDKKV